MSRYAAVVLEGAARPVLEAAAELALGFGPRCAIEEGAVIIDVTGCAHLHGGEAELLSKLKERLGPLHDVEVPRPKEVAPVPQGMHTHPRHLRPEPSPAEPRVELKPRRAVRVAIADAPKVALALARGGGESFEALPLSAVGFEEEALEYFAALSIHTVGELQALPVFELERRLPASARAAVALVHGEDAAALTWWAPPEVPEACVELDHGVEHLEPLLFVLKGLVDPLCSRLEARGELLVQAELWVKYEKLPELQQREATWEAVFPAPLRDAKAVLNVLKLKLEAQGLRAPVREVRVRFTQRAKAEPRALHLWTKETESASALPTLIAELLAELGEECVGALTVEDRHAASSRTQLSRVGATSTTPVSPWVTLTYATREPLRSQKAEPWNGSTSGRLLLRRQGVEWWTRGFSDAWDSLAVWVDGFGATAWVDQRLGDSFDASSWLRGWVEG
jgi:nucleotidyltransferase/DNA polymerase involved in DNA repair